MRRLREYLLASAVFTVLGVGTLYAILRGAHLVIRQCRSWFGRWGQSKKLDPAEFARRRDEVKAAYAPLPEGEVTVCLDVKRVYHRPEKGACWQHEAVPGDRPARVEHLLPRPHRRLLSCTRGQIHSALHRLTRASFAPYDLVQRSRINGDGV